MVHYSYGGSLEWFFTEGEHDAKNELYSEVEVLKRLEISS